MGDAKWLRRKDLLQLAVVLLLATALVLVVLLLRDARTEARQVRAQLDTSTQAQACRARFANEDDRLNRFRDGALLAIVAVSLEAPRNQERIKAVVDYAVTLSPASVNASAERTASSQICTANPDAQPTFHDIPEPPI